MRSVADELREEQRQAELALSPDERVRRALAMGELALEAYRAARGIDRATALRELEAQRQRGRRPCSFLPKPPA
jgi:hypothetical protein